MGQHEAALKAWRTMRGPVWKAQRAARLSKEALSQWAERSGFHIAFFDGPSGNPRTGIVDAVLLRVRPRAPDEMDLYLVQLKGGGAGMTPTEMSRLKKAAADARAKYLVALHDGNHLHFLPQEPTDRNGRTAEN